VISANTALQKKLDGYQRCTLAHYPTPLELLPRISEKEGRKIYVKRDDGIGPGMGGNKTRKLEYLLAEAQEGNFRKIASFGGLQSNHVRITSAAARKFGFEPHLFFFEPRPKHLSGNLQVNRILGAKMHFIPIGSGGGMSLETTIALVRWVARLFIGRHYFIPVGGHSWLGCLGYVRAAIEIETQTKTMGIQNPTLVMAAGTGGTLAGLMAGFAILDSSIKLLGIDVGKLWKGFPSSIAHLAEEICAQLGAPHRFNLEDVPLCEDRYVGAKYGMPSAQGTAALRQVARLEGLLLDPVYTAKAFAAMMDLNVKGKIEGDEPLIFLHTGGLPTLFAAGKIPQDEGKRKVYA